MVKYFLIEQSVHFLELLISTTQNFTQFLQQLHVATEEQFGILNNYILSLYAWQSGCNIYDTQLLFFSLAATIIEFHVYNNV